MATSQKAQKIMKNMADKYDYKSPEHAHWRIDEVIKTMGGLTEVVEDHDKEFERIRDIHRGVKIAIYTAATVIIVREVGLFHVLRAYIGL